MRTRLIALLILFLPLVTIAQEFDFFAQEKENHWVDSIMAEMSLQEKVSQLIFVRVAHYSIEDKNDSLLNSVERLKPGGVVFFAGKPMEQAELTNNLQARSKVPLLVSIDAEWGLGMWLENTISFPYQIALGAIQDDNLIYKMGEEIARQCRRLGIHINFAPVVDVNNNADNPVINYRSFGESADNVARKGLMYARGLQNNMVLPTPKHFPGHGDTGVDSHFDLPVLDFTEERLNSVELYPFKSLIDEGVGGMMIAHLNVPVWEEREEVASSISEPIVTGVLKDQLGFRGLSFTDALEMQGITKHFPAGKAAVESFLAGNDILLLPADVEDAINEIASKVRTRDIDPAELEKRVEKVLRLKFRFGLSDMEPIKTDDLIADLNSPAAQLLNRQLIESSITLLKNDGTLPIKELQNKNVASISIGREVKTAFQDRLDDYTKVDHFNISHAAGKEDISEILNAVSNHNLVIIGVHDNSIRPRNTEILSQDVRAMISMLSGRTEVILASFRNPYTLNDESLLQADAIITPHFDTELSQDLTAQAIFGATDISGRLSVSINESYKSGHGIELKSVGRFKYTLPEEEGINGSELHDRISAIVREGLDSAAYPGAQVLVAKKGKIIYHETFGHHTYDRIREVSKDDVYDFASVTKITGGLPGLMLLHDQGKFSLDASLRDYFPLMKGSNKANIDWRLILSHHGRLMPWIPYWTTTFKKNGKFKSKTLSYTKDENFSIELKEGLYQHKDYRSKIYKMIRKSPLNEEEGYRYSGLSFYLMPEMVENLSGTEDFESYLKENLYQKLGAHTLTYNPSRFFDLEQLVPTENDTFFRKMQIHGVVHDEGAAMMQGVSGNAGLFGSANDLAKIMQMYQNMGKFGGERYISEYTLKEFTTCHYCEEQNHRGLGFDKPLLTNRENGTPAPSADISSFGHSGYTGTFTWADPKNEILFVFFSNRVYPTRLNTKLYSQSIRPRIHQVIYDLSGIE